MMLLSIYFRDDVAVLSHLPAGWLFQGEPLRCSSFLLLPCLYNKHHNQGYNRRQKGVLL